MKKIFSGRVFDVLPLSDGIIFSYCKDVIDENTIVSYKMISFENGHFTDVARNIYLLTKFGNNYKATAMFCGNYITAKSIVLPNSKVFLLEDNGSAALLDNDATLLWSGELKYRGGAAADIALYKNTLWASFPECNVLLRYNLSTMREELRIGSKRDGAFSRPCGLAEANGKLIVCNTVSKCIETVDPESYVVERFATFDEPVYQYVRSGNDSVVLLGSGVYIL